MNQFVLDLLADGQVHSTASLYSAVENRGLVDGDRLRVPTGAGYEQLSSLGLNPNEMSPQEKDAAVEEHGLPFEHQYKNLVRFSIRDLKDSGAIISPSRAHYQLAKPGEVVANLYQTSREALVKAMREFDDQLRNQAQWIGWEVDGNYKFAVVHEGHRYPPKQVLAMATGNTKRAFSGGDVTNRVFVENGFEVVELRASAEPLNGLSAALRNILAGYAAARNSGAYSKDHEVVAEFRRAQTALRKSRPLATRPTMSVEFSAGKGNWASVPWIAIMDDRETDTTQEGRYVVFLFREDCTGVYVTLNQGVTAPQREHGRTVGLQRVRERALTMRALVASLADDGFSLEDTIQLQSDAGLGKTYEASTVAHKFYASDAMPPDAQLEEDLEAVLAAYEDVIEPEAQGRAWIFQANPDTYDVSAAVRKLGEISWTVSRHGDSIRVGDRVYLWESGKAAGIVATAEVIDEVRVREEEALSRQFWRKPAQYKAGPRVLLRIDEVLADKFPKQRLVDDPRFKDLGFLRGPMGTNFPLTEEHHRALEEMLAPISIPPDELCESFSAALRTAGLTFGDEHEAVVQCFLASVLTKPFVILTGLSGSGKTQLALKLGEWLGDGRYRVIPVRPDWTGPESLLGYEDALLPSMDGRRAWHVPEALHLVLRAARDPQRPYLLILDEMNLAHVERYFADVLSGVESREAVLPNLERGADGLWRVPAGKSEKIQMPRNLVLIGTVNVDETTYMFSPKVLDRANTIEFRVPTTSLSADPTCVTKPGKCKPATEAQTTSLLRIVVDDMWQTTNPSPSLSEFAALVRQLHDGLSHHGFEFGHRTYYEALRLASVLFACGVEDTDAAVDVFVLQKVLHRLHGSRRKLEPILRMVAAFAFDRRASAGGLSDFDPLQDHAPKTPRMPRSFIKLRRMTRALFANQFASFSDQ
ncbi:MAG TPA: DUF3578 domain-containing protein [Kofleriaceae bacterium]|jgi:hypothetical protein